MLGPLISFLSLPIITRLYSENEIAEFYFAVALTQFFIIILNLNVNQSILSSNSIFSIIKRLSLSISLAFMLFTAIIIATFIYSLFSDIESYFWFALVYSLLGSWILTFNILLARFKKIKTIALFAVSKPLLFIFCTLGSYYFLNEPYSLYISYLFAELLTLFAILYIFRKNIFLLKRLKIQKKMYIDDVAWSYSKYILPSSVNSAGFNVFLMWVLKISSAEMLAIYVLLYRLVGVPVNAVASGVKLTIYRSYIDHKICLTSFQKKAVLILSIIIFIIAILEPIYGDLIFGFYLGKNYTNYSNFLLVTLIWLASSLLLAIPVEILKHSPSKKIIFKIDMIGMLFKVLGVYLLWLNYNGINYLNHLFIMLTSINITSFFIYNFYLRNQLKVHE